MKKIFGLLVVSLLCVGLAQAALYIKFDGVDGDYTDKAHKDWIEIQSYSWGMSNPTTSSGGSGGAGKVVMQDFHFTKTLDKSSPKLAEALAKGTHIPKVEFQVAKTSGSGQSQVYLKYELENVIVSSYQIAGDNSNQYPTEEVTINFEKIKMSYMPTDSKGNLGRAIEFIWNFLTNTAN